MFGTIFSTVLIHQGNQRVQQNLKTPLCSILLSYHYVFWFRGGYSMVADGSKSQQVRKHSCKFHKHNNINLKTHQNLIKWRGQGLYSLNLIGQTSGNVQRSMLTGDHTEEDRLGYHTLHQQRKTGKKRSFSLYNIVNSSHGDVSVTLNMNLLLCCSLLLPMLSYSTERVDALCVGFFVLFIFFAVVSM